MLKTEGTKKNILQMQSDPPCHGSHKFMAKYIMSLSCAVGSILSETTLDLDKSTKPLGS
jgi:hypothetical protein